MQANVLTAFQFILQADFILAASREDVEQDNPWNNTLVAAARDCFIHCVNIFNQSGTLQYTWPKYLQSQPRAQDTVFAGFDESLIRHLRLQPVLQSQTLTMERPADLQCVKVEFTDGLTPLLCGPGGMRYFAHSGYHWQDLSVLEVSQQSSAQFVSLLQDFIKRHPLEFRQKSLEWHSCLASAIVATGADNVRGLSIIPLRSGKWISAKSKQSFFPDLGEGAIVPKGIEVDVVEDAAAADHARRTLYHNLGVSTLDEATVFTLILQQHGRQTPSKCFWPADEVVEHGWFLFRAKSFPREFDLTKLMVATRDAKLRSGKDVYMDLPGAAFPLSKFLNKTASSVQYLDDSYYEVPGSQAVDNPNGPETLRKKWLRWLHDPIGVRTVPRLVVAGSISPEFETIVKLSERNEWLELLTDEWNDYAIDLQASGNEKLKASLRSSTVLCTDGQRRPLVDAYLPTRSVLSEPLAKGIVPIIDVKDPNNEDWRKLGRALQMKTTCDGQFFISILQQMRAGACGFTVDDVRRMYSGMAQNWSPQAA